MVAAEPNSRCERALGIEGEPNVPRPFFLFCSGDRFRARVSSYTDIVPLVGAALVSLFPAARFAYLEDVLVRQVIDAQIEVPELRFA